MTVSPVLQSPPRFDQHGNERGFSLIEVVIATGILGTALVTVAALLTMSTDALLAARQRTAAAALASARLEELLADTAALRAGVESSDQVNDAGGVEPRASGWCPSRAVPHGYQGRYSRRQN